MLNKLKEILTSKWKILKEILITAGSKIRILLKDTANKLVDIAKSAWISIKVNVLYWERNYFERKGDKAYANGDRLWIKAEKINTILFKDVDIVDGDSEDIPTNIADIID
ncbi:hypothetical protein LCGC14_1328690 [marine sediment metagenome]|uniref:Uncharacterized protein n=1 Tax=marine sediment metagenome TaxID=412755 RepID=A0A0F9L368_9ZZZZ